MGAQFLSLRLLKFEVRESAQNHRGFTLAAVCGVCIIGLHGANRGMLFSGVEIVSKENLERASSLDRSIKHQHQISTFQTPVLSALGFLCLGDFR
jgi:hypothetical protein